MRYSEFRFEDLIKRVVKRWELFIEEVFFVEAGASLEDPRFLSAYRDLYGREGSLIIDIHIYDVKLIWLGPYNWI